MFTLQLQYFEEVIKGFGLSMRLTTELFLNSLPDFELFPDEEYIVILQNCRKCGRISNYYTTLYSEISLTNLYCHEHDHVEPLFVMNYDN